MIPYLRVRGFTVHAQLLADPTPLHHGDGRLGAEEHKVGHDARDGNEERRSANGAAAVAIALGGGRGTQCRAGEACYGQAQQAELEVRVEELGLGQAEGFPSRRCSSVVFRGDGVVGAPC